MAKSAEFCRGNHTGSCRCNRQLACSSAASRSQYANADNYVALAYSFRSDVAGMAKSADAEQARIAALKNCQDNGGNHCVWFGTFANECAALAILGAQEWSTATGPELRIARNNALQQNSWQSHRYVRLRRLPLPTGPSPSPLTHWSPHRSNTCHSGW